MAAPIYTQKEVDDLLAMPKVVQWDSRGRRGWDTHRERESITIQVIVEGDEDIRFSIEAFRNTELGEFSLILKGQIGARPLEGLCRYDIHDGPHRNHKDFWPPDEIADGKPHVHKYREKAIRQGLTWHSYAEILPDDCASVNDLTSRFLKDCNIKFQDKEPHQDLFGFMNDE